MSHAQRTVLLAAVVTVVTVGIVSLALLSGERDSSPSPSDLVTDVDPGPIHVHGLGINPADRSLFIATHTGLYRVAPGQPRATLVGESRQDTMGFTVAGPNRFLGSGHPDPTEAQNLPPLLGLIESRDAGKTWRPVSLLGKADFHVLRAAGLRVYGYDATADRLLVSADRGRTWRPGTRPAALVDLAVDPRDSKRLLASSATNLFFSRDGGRIWSAAGALSGYLAWPAPRRVYLVSGRGEVLSSQGVRRPWVEVGNIGGEPAAFLGLSEDELYVALHDGTVKSSLDGGRTWRVRSTP